MKKTLIPSIIAMMITVPSLGAVIDNTNCDSGTLQTTSGDATLRAKFDANTINIKYYNGNTEITNTVNNNAKSCTYDAGITLPSTNPTKAGYTFNGWKVKPAQCSYDALHTFFYGGETRFDCSSEISTDLVNGDGSWSINLSDCNENAGVIQGKALCSSHPGAAFSTGDQQWDGNNNTATYSELTDAGTDGAYCWCKIESYIDTDNKQCMGSDVWVSYTPNTPAFCAYNCANSCAYITRVYTKFRSMELFGRL